ncbi:MAG: hypothetical protein Q7J29_08950 [Stagnimonas sp.]|nr:hypothetical protein [Stagnimonas sp.]
MDNRGLIFRSGGDDKPLDRPHGFVMSQTVITLCGIHALMRAP